MHISLLEVARILLPLAASANFTQPLRDKVALPSKLHMATPTLTAKKVLTRPRPRMWIDFSLRHPRKKGLESQHHLISSSSRQSNELAVFSPPHLQSSIEAGEVPM